VQVLKYFALGGSAKMAACEVINLLNSVPKDNSPRSIQFRKRWEAMFPYLHLIPTNTKAYNGVPASTELEPHEPRSAELDSMFTECDLKNWAQGGENGLSPDRCQKDPRYLVNLAYTALHENQDVTIDKCMSLATGKKDAKTPPTGEKHLKRIFAFWQSSAVGCHGE
jgi:hypothetical protein